MAERDAFGREVGEGQATTTPAAGGLGPAARTVAGLAVALLIVRSGALRNVQVTADGRLRDFGAAGSGAGGLPTVAFSAVDPAAPGRIVRAAARRAGRAASRVDYLVLLMLPNGQSWNVYFKPDGLHFMADRHGRNLRRL